MGKLKYEFEVNERARVIADDELCVAIDCGHDNAMIFDRESAKRLRDALNLWLYAGQPPSDKEDKVAVLLGDGDPEKLIFAMGEGAWKYIADGKTHTFDLTGMGIPLQVLICGGPTRASVLDDIKRGILMQGGTFDDGSGEGLDLGIKPPSTH